MPDFQTNPTAFDRQARPLNRHGKLAIDQPGCLLRCRVTARLYSSYGFVAALSPRWHQTCSTSNFGCCKPPSGPEIAHEFTALKGLMKGSRTCGATNSSLRFRLHCTQCRTPHVPVNEQRAEMIGYSVLDGKQARPLQLHHSLVASLIRDLVSNTLNFPPNGLGSREQLRHQSTPTVSTAMPVA